MLRNLCDAPLPNTNEDPAKYLHYNGTRTTPDLLLASSGISEHTRSRIIDDPGFGHKQVIASINIGSKIMSRKAPTRLAWNFKKADWSGFTNLLDNEHHTSPLNFNQHPDKLCTTIKNVMIRCAKKTIPRGKTKHYRVFWSKYLEEAKRKRDALRNTADQYWKRDALRNTADQTGRTNALRNTADLTGRTERTNLETTISFHLEYQLSNTSFDKFISNINYQSDDQRTFKFLRNLQNNPTHQFLGNLQNNRERPTKRTNALKHTKKNQYA
ncbi:unnamed protein product [Rodentolepis nana]|uniref:Endo/exonuclease/phosphatase domain-containing protein n=1 Tax=Rodentolepis nana TaxID=102285 RepID=A0A0R3TCU2_RODNA|nr:unnamed protein product [Rodentolepis nana]